MEGGFTLVEEGAEVIQSKKKKGTDGMVTTVHGISQEEGSRIYREALKRGQSIGGLDSDEEREERAKILKLDHGEDGMDAGGQAYGNLGSLWGFES